MAEYLSEGVWLVATQVALRFTVVCRNSENRITSNKRIVKPPIGIVRWNMSCAASNDYIKLLPFFQKKSQYNIVDPIDNLIKTYTNISNVALWTPFREAFLI